MQYGSCSEGYIHQLRMPGRSRYARFQSLIQQGVKLTHRTDLAMDIGSPCFRALRLDNYWHSESDDWYESRIGPGMYVDLCCGDSPDCDIAACMGYFAFGLDIVRRAVFDQWGGADMPKVYKRDVTQPLPFGSETVDAVSLNAAIDLIEPHLRPALYAEIYRILVPSSFFAINFIGLKRGHGFDRQSEIAHMEKAGFVRCEGFQGGGVLMQKGS
jgi:SAM-dependent methyltransferase